MRKVKLFLLVIMISILNISVIQNADASTNNNTYTINYNANGGIGKKIIQKCNRDSYVRLASNKYIKKGYIFVGWTKNKNGTGVIYKNRQVVKNITNSKNVILYAKWLKIKYSINYKLNGGTNNKLNPKYFTIDSKTIVLKEPKKNGYIFGGWYLKSKGTKQIKYIKKGSCKSIYIYAKWIKIPVNRINFLKNLVDLTVDKRNINEANIKDYSYLYKDLKNASDDNKKIINYAIYNKIISKPEKNTNFYPYNAATRDYVSYTTVNALKFVNSVKIKCIDVKEIKYPYHANIALNQQFFLLDKKGTFCPKKYISLKEYNNIIKKIEEIKGAYSETDTNIEKVKYNDNVTVVNDKSYSYKTTVKNDKNFYDICVNDSDILKDSKVGDVVVFPKKDDNSTNLPVKILSVNNSNTTKKSNIVAVEVESISEVFEEVELAGVTDNDGLDIDALNDEANGLESIYCCNNNSNKGDYATKSIDFVGTTNKDAKLIFNLGKKDNLGDGLKLSGSLEVAIPNITYNIMLTDRAKIKNLYVRVHNDFNANINLKMTYNHGAEGKILIKKIPFKIGTTGFRVNVCVFLKYDVSGNFGIEYSLSPDIEVKYVKGNLICGDLDSNSSNIEFYTEAKCKIGPEFAVIISWCFIDIFDVSCNIGGCINTKLVARSNGLECMDTNMYIYLDICLGDNSDLFSLLKKFNICTSLVFPIWNDENSNFKWKLHRERKYPELFKVVEKCTCIDNTKEIKEMLPILQAVIEGNYRDGEWKYYVDEESAWHIINDYVFHSSYKSNIPGIKIKEDDYYRQFVLLDKNTAENILSSMSVHYNKLPDIPKGLKHIISFNEKNNYYEIDINSDCNVRYEIIDYHSNNDGSVDIIVGEYDLFVDVGDIISRYKFKVIPNTYKNAFYYYTVVYCEKI